MSCHDANKMKTGPKFPSSYIPPTITKTNTRFNPSSLLSSKSISYNKTSQNLQSPGSQNEQLDQVITDLNALNTVVNVVRKQTVKYEQPNSATFQILGQSWSSYDSKVDDDEEPSMPVNSLEE